MSEDVGALVGGEAVENANTNRPVQQHRPALVVARHREEGSPGLLWVALITNPTDAGEATSRSTDLAIAGLPVASIASRRTTLARSVRCQRPIVPRFAAKSPGLLAAVPGTISEARGVSGRRHEPPTPHKKVLNHD